MVFYADRNIFVDTSFPSLSGMSNIFPLVFLCGSVEDVVQDYC